MATGRAHGATPTVRIAFFLFTDSDWIWTERKKGASENLNAQGDMLSHSNWPFSAHLHLQHLGFNVCVYVNLCANSRGEKGMGRLWYMVLSCNTTGLEKRTGENWVRRSRIFGLLSGSHDQHTVQSLPKVKWLLREWKKSFWYANLVKMRKKQFTINFNKWTFVFLWFEVHTPFKSCRFCHLNFFADAKCFCREKSLLGNF